jgi:hypothetical protein
VLHQLSAALNTKLRHYLSAMRPVLLIVLMSINTAWAQGLQLQHRIEGAFASMTTDNLGQVYVTQGAELFLYKRSGELSYRYSDLSYGRIGSVDTRNPMKVQVFYPDFSRIVFLDNTMSKNREQSLRLDQLQLSLVHLVCTSFDNGIWVYDPVNFRLLRFDQHMNVTNSIENVNQLVGASLDPTIMVEEGDWLYLNDPEQGIFRFDVFGTYSKMIPTTGVTGLQVRENGIFLTKETGFFQFDPLNFEESEISLPIGNAISVRLEKEHLYILDPTGVSIYHFTQ